MPKTEAPRAPRHPLMPAPPAPGTAQQLKAFLRDTLGAFPWRIRVSDWTGQQYSLGLGESHWSGDIRVGGRGVR